VPNVYDPEEDQLNRDDASIPHSLNDITGISPEQEAAHEREAYSGAARDIAKREGLFNPHGDGNSAGIGDKVKALTMAGLSAAETGAGFYNATDNPLKTAGKVKNLVWGNRRKAVGGGLAALLIGGGFFGLTILSGPAQFIHFSHLLSGFHFTHNEDDSNNRLMKIGRFVYYAKDRHLERTRLGTLGNKFADRAEAKLNAAGYESTYSNLTGLDEGIKIKKDTPHWKNKSPEQIKSELLSTNPGLSEADIKINNGSVVVDVKSNNYIKNALVSKQFIRSVLKGEGFSTLGTFGDTRLIAKRRGITLHPLREADNKALGSFEKWLKAKSEKVTKGSSDVPQVKEEPKKGANGKDDPMATQNASDASSNASSAVNDAKTAGTATASGDATAFSKAINSIHFKVAAGGAALAGVMCLAHGLAEHADSIKDGQVVAPAERIGADIVATGEQLESGQDTSMSDLGYQAQMLHDTASPKTSANYDTTWASARSIKAELGEDQAGPVVDKTLTTIGQGSPFDFLLSGPINAALAPICSTGGIAVITIVSFLGGPVSTLAGTAAGLAFGPEVEGALAHWLSGQALNTLPRGAALGDTANYGVKMLADEQAAAAGGVPLNQGTVAQIRASERGYDQAIFQQQSLAYQLFNPYDSQSMLGQIIDKQSPGPSQNLSNMAVGFLNFGHALASAIGNAGKAKVFAASAAPYDYGTPTFGFTPDEMNKPMVDNPFENAEKVADLLDSNNANGEPDYISRAEKCFGAKIAKDSSGAWDVTYDSEPLQLYGKSYKEVASDCKDSSDNWLRIRFFVFDTQNMKSEACYLDDEISCQDLSIEGASSSSNQDGGLGISADGFVFPEQTTKTKVKAGSSYNGQTLVWCMTSQTNCHHQYNAADIFDPTGTPVVAVRDGSIVYEVGGASGGTGSFVILKTNPDNEGKSYIYYYGHLGAGSVKVQTGQQVKAGDVLGAIGTAQDAQGTSPHLHIDAQLSPPATTREACTDAACAQPPFNFINLQPTLVKAYEALPN
jgi:hypothetical protein